MQETAADVAAISQHEVLRLEECERIRDRIFALRDRWTPRAEGGAFFTLGVAAYLDAPRKHESYLNAAKSMNCLLHENFEWLYERVRSGFQNLLGRDVFYDNDCPLPGFHVFRYQGEDQSNDRPSTRAHFDMQWFHAMPGCRPEETLSFTVSIEEPTGGSSLQIWPLHSHSVPPGLDVLEYAAGHPSKTVRYSRGHMILHDGLLLHAIGVSSVAKPEGYRITFQGHGVRVGENWTLYW
jgi:hypothetical protein